jgi:hypothetical protein
MKLWSTTYLARPAGLYTFHVWVEDSAPMPFYSPRWAVDPYAPPLTASHYVSNNDPVNALHAALYQYIWLYRMRGALGVRALPPTAYFLEGGPIHELTHCVTGATTLADCTLSLASVHAIEKLPGFHENNPYRGQPATRELKQALIPLAPRRMRGRNITTRR